MTWKSYSFRLLCPPCLARLFYGWGLKWLQYHLCPWFSPRCFCLYSCVGVSSCEGFFAIYTSETVRFKAWLNSKENSGLVKFVPELGLPFVQISSIYWKTVVKAWNWYERWLERNGTRSDNIPTGKVGLYIFSDVTLLPEIFHWTDPRSPVPFT